jgi:hypothetical protein
VRFKANLEEEIVTKVYVMSHADLSSSEDEIQTSETDESSSASTNEGDNDDGQRIIRVDEYAARGRRKRKTSTLSESSSRDVDRGREERSRSTSARRSKRKRRRWEWTIKSVRSDLDLSSGENLELTAKSTASEHGPVVSQETDIGNDTEWTAVTCGLENEAEALHN